MIRRILYVWVMLLFLSGCASFSDKPSKVILQNPQTMEFVNCRVDEWGTSESYRKNEECVQSYIDQGFVIWGER